MLLFQLILIVVGTILFLAGSVASVMSMNQMAAYDRSTSFNVRGWKDEKPESGKSSGVS